MGEIYIQVESSSQEREWGQIRLEDPYCLGNFNVAETESASTVQAIQLENLKSFQISLIQQLHSLSFEGLLLQIKKKQHLLLPPYLSLGYFTLSHLKNSSGVLG